MPHQVEIDTLRNFSQGTLRNMPNREELVKLRDMLAKLVDEGYHEYAFVLGQTIGKIMIIDQLSESEK